MNTAIVEVLACIGFGTVCVGIIASIAGLFVCFEDYFIQKKIKKMEKKANEK